MKIAYFDCFSGAAGDMIVGACLDAGAPQDHLRRELGKLSLTEVDLHIEKINKKGISSTVFHPRINKSSVAPEHHRHMADIEAIIKQSDISATAKSRALAIFGRLAQAEAKVHGARVEKVHFHEVGAADAIVDIVGACIALESLGVEKVYCSALTVGSGTIQCEHGILPVPAPATAELIKGIAIQPSAVKGELLTPTGAAILTTLADEFGTMPDICIENIGYGAGQRDVPDIPNVLRLFVGATAAGGRTDALFDQVALLETNLDDVSGEIIGDVSDNLLQAGALDVYYTAISMKKNRPGTMLSVICRPEDITRMEQIIFQQSSAFGIRRQISLRSILSRDYITVTTVYGDVRIKVGFLAGRPVSYAAEYEDCRRLARQHQVPVKEVMTAALAAYQRSKVIEH